MHTQRARHPAAHCGMGLGWHGRACSGAPGNRLSTSDSSRGPRRLAWSIRGLIQEMVLGGRRRVDRPHQHGWSQPCYGLRASTEGTQHLPSAALRISHQAARRDQTGPLDGACGMPCSCVWGRGSLPSAPYVRFAPPGGSARQRRSTPVQGATRDTSFRNRRPRNAKVRLRHTYPGRGLAH